MSTFSQRLLPVLQLTRMALVFTALADSGSALLLHAHKQMLGNGLPLIKQFVVVQCVALMMISVGLYGFGMSLNDIIDRRRDRLISPTRPLPSGSIGLGAAHAICAMLALMALLGAEIYSFKANGTQLSLIFAVVTMGLISFYDFTAKYFVPMGLLALGVIRFFHASIAAPELPVLWHPILLMNHVAIVSALAYHWEQKRPRLRRAHFRWMIFGLILANLVVLTFLGLHRHANDPRMSISQLLDISPTLIAPAVAVGVFAIVATWIWRRGPNRRVAGQNLNLIGLLWLIVYDAVFVTGYVGFLEGLAILVFLPIAYLSFWIISWWSKLMLLSQRPTFRRVET